MADSEHTEKRHLPGWARIDWIVLWGMTAFAFVLRLVRLGEPGSLIFDETYYAKDACYYLNGAADFCETESEITYVHPPLGKWLIALGIRLFGYDSFGWRISALVAGVITIALFYVLARKLLGSVVPAAFTTGLLVIDPLHFVQSRTSMLDIFVPLFGVAAFVFLLFDRDRLLARVASGDDVGRGLLDRPWRIAAGAAGGGALACKWSGGLILLAVIVISIAWEVKARSQDEKGRALLRTAREELPTIVVWMVLLPIAFYAFTYIGRVGGSLFALPWSQGSWFRAVWDLQHQMLDFHSTLASHHSYESPAWSWILIKRPVSYAFTSAEGNYQEIFATGSPFVWWSSLLAMGYVAYRWIRRTGLGRPEGVILGGFVLSYVPWLVAGALSDRQAVFIFYLLPTVPFMILALGYVLSRLGDSWEAKATLGLFSIGALGLFAFYYPLLTNISIPQPDWQNRIWIFDNCDKPPGPSVTSLVTETVDGTPTTRETVTQDNSSIPPNGWCWI